MLRRYRLVPKFRHLLGSILDQSQFFLLPKHRWRWWGDVGLDLDWVWWPKVHLTHWGRQWLFL